MSALKRYLNTERKIPKTNFFCCSFPEIIVCFLDFKWLYSFFLFLVIFNLIYCKFNMYAYTQHTYNSHFSWISHICTEAHSHIEKERNTETESLKCDSKNLSSRISQIIYDSFVFTTVYPVHSILWDPEFLKKFSIFSSCTNAWLLCDLWILDLKKKNEQRCNMRPCCKEVPWKIWRAGW